jgi:hypothetical protein
MSSGENREVRRKARASAHTRHTRTCDCGKVISGNGWRSHARTCRDYLKANGWPFTNTERDALMDGFREYIDEALERIRALREAQFNEAIRRGLITRDEIARTEGDR